jgi:AcrR family transcriptional regulator
MTTAAAVASAPPLSREQLLVIAGRLFAEHGYHGTSIRLIAADAGVQSATLYGHFDSKAAMFKELIVRYFDEIKVRLEDIAVSAVPAADKLELMIRCAIEVGRNHRDGFIALSNSWKQITITPELSSLMQARLELYNLWNRIILAAAKDGALRPGVAPRDLLWIIYAAVTGMVDDRYQAAAGAPTTPPVELLVSIFRGGLWQDSEAPGAPAAPARRKR